MFTDFLYLLRSYGMKTSLNEWNSLMDALEMNLNDASLTEFYYMARAVLVKKESEYDKFDQAFLAYFKNVQTFEELPKEVLDWLAKAHAQTPYDKDEVDARFAGLDLDDIRKMMAERLKEQHEQHHGGNKWIGTGGTSAFGHSGYSPKGIRRWYLQQKPERAAGGGTAELPRFPRRCGHPDPAVSGGAQKAASFILP